MEEFRHITQAPGNPDILRHILDFLEDDPKTRAARVSLAWFEAATDLLWRRASSKRLAWHVHESRQQLYASKLTHVGEEDGENPQLFHRCKDLQFPHLRMARFSLDDPVFVTEKGAAEESQPFPRLTDFGGAVMARGVTLLLRLMPNLTSLDLTLSDAEIPCLSHISTLTGLQKLILRFPINAELPRAEILSLRSLSKLGVLSIDTSGAVGNAYEVESEEELDFTDGHFEQLVSSLPEQQVLHMMCECTLTAKSMLHLAKYCRRLRNCSLSLADIDITTLNLHTRSEVAFPNVHQLRWGYLRASGNSGVSQFVKPFPPSNCLGHCLTRRVNRTTDGELPRTLQKHFPRLTDLFFESEHDLRDFCPDIMATFSEVIDANRRKPEADRTKFVIYTWQKKWYYGPGEFP